jgi:anti-sigma-K factor RskA
MSRDLSTGDIHALAGAYALDALNDIERATFDRHAAECEVCAVEAAELQETVGRMAEVSWSVPPPRMRRAVLAEVSRTRQVGGRRRDSGRAAPAAPTQWRRRAGLAVAAAVLVAGGGAATWAVLHQQQEGVRKDLRVAQAQARQISDVMSAPDAQIHRGGQVTVVFSPARDAGVAILDNLPDPGRTRAYELWAIRDGGQAISVGLLDPGINTATVLVRNLTGAAFFGVSREPAGGSLTPTQNAIVQTIKL